MPKRPLRQCNQSGCPNLADRSYCEQHKDKEKPFASYDKDRPSAKDRGYGARWQKVRVLFLRKNPYCAECHSKGILTVARVVDHIIPHKGNQSLFWDENNWQSLCDKCHNEKTFREIRGG